MTGDSDPGLSLPDPDGIILSRPAREYIGELRATCSLGSTTNHGVAAGNRLIQMKSEEAETTVAQTTEPCGREVDRVSDKQFLMDRRRFMQATGAGVATVVVGTGTALGQTDAVVPDFSSDFTPNPWIEGKYEIAEQKADMGPLGFIDDNSEEDSLANYGGVVAPREDDDLDVDPTPHNWYRFSADGLETAEYSDFPRGVTKIDVYDSPAEDEEDEEVSILKAEHWDTTGGATVEDAGRALQISGGDTNSAEFTRMKTLEDPARRILQLVANVDAIDAGRQWQSRSSIRRRIRSRRRSTQTGTSTTLISSLSKRATATFSNRKSEN